MVAHKNLSILRDEAGNYNPLRGWQFSLISTQAEVPTNVASFQQSLYSFPLKADK